MDALRTASCQHSGEQYFGLFAGSGWPQISQQDSLAGAIVGEHLLQYFWFRSRTIN
jgi:hypothetical protein